MSSVTFSSNVAHTGQCSIDSGEDEPPEGNIAKREKEHHNEEREWKTATDTTSTTKTSPKHKETDHKEPEIKEMPHPDGNVLCDVLGDKTQGVKPNQDAGQKVVHFSWVSPKLEARVNLMGTGVFALVDIPKDDHLVVWTGRILSTEQALPIMQTHDKHYILQIGDGFYQVPLCEYREPADWTNHSCEPNAGFGKNSPICLSAMRDIKAGEQIFFDYAMCETDERLWEPMDCLCGTPSCRGKITAHDWKMPQLRQKYAGYWSPHVARAQEELDRQNKPLTPPLSSATQQTAENTVLVTPGSVVKATKAGLSIVRAKPGKKGGKKRVLGRKKSRGPRRFRIGA